MTNYTYQRAHYPNNVSWYREIVWLDDNAVAEINEPTDSTMAHKIYRVMRYEPVPCADGYVDVLRKVAQFDTVCDCKEFINNGGLN